MKYFPLLWRNLLRKKVRTALTLASVFVAFALFGLLVAVKTGLGAGVDLAGLDRLIMIHKVSLIQLLPESYGNKILADEGVADVAHATWFGGTYKDPKNFFPRIAIEPEAYLRVYPEIRLPEEQKQAFIRNRIGAIVGRSTAKKYGMKVGDRVPIQGDIWRTQDGSAWEFVIEGIYDADKGFDTTNFFFHYKYLTEASGHEGQVGWYVLTIKDPEHSAEVAERLDAFFANSPAETKTSTEKAFVQGFANQIGDIAAIVTWVSAVVFFTLLLVTGNTVAQSVRERTNEMGVLKTLGFSDVQMMGLVLAESLLVTFLGGGLGLGVVTFATHSFDIGGTVLPMFFLPWRDVWLGMGLLVLMALLSGAVPAVRALRLPIVDALRRT